MEKVVFYLMNQKGFYVLTDFLEKFSVDRIEYVVLSPDKNVVNDYYNDLLKLCKIKNIQYFNRQEDIPKFNGYKFSIGWRWLIEDSDNIIVLHDSILPKYRGYCPIVNMLINKEEFLGVTAIFASKDYDKGDIIQQEKISITYPIKIKQAINSILPLYSRLISNISNLIFGGIPFVVEIQDEKKASYSLWRDERDYYIDWSKDASTIRRMVDALGYPYLGAHTFLDKELIIVEDVEEYSDVTIENRDVGKVIFMCGKYPVVVCGKGLLKIKNAKYSDGNSIFPLKKYRVRFGGMQYD